MDLAELISAFRSVLGRRYLPRVIEIERARHNISQCMESILEGLSDSGRLDFYEMFSTGDRGRVVCIFIALLELAKLGRIRLIQEVKGGDIVILLRGTG